MSVRLPSMPEEVGFGVFTVDLRAGELRKNDLRVKLQERPFKILTILLEHPGEVLTREELRSRLWPDGTFVDFDHSISSAIKKLRDALNDSASTPRYIATVGRRGYRFIYPVMRRPANIVSIAVGAGIYSPGLAGNGNAVVEEQASRRNAFAPSQPRRSWLWAAGALGAVALAIGIAAAMHARSGMPIIAPGDRVVLADIENHTGNAVFDGTLLRAMRVKLNESPYLTLVPDAAFRAQLKQRGTAAKGPAGLEISREACRQLGAKALVSGEIIPASAGAYTLRLSALRCSDGRVIAHDEAKPASAEQALPALGQLTDNIRRRLGEPAGTLEQFHTPMIQATTASVAALKAFSAGEEKRAEGKDYEAIPLYSMATDLDPGFALAYARLGAIYQNAQETVLGNRNYEKAFENRERSTERERLYLTAHYYGTTGDIQKTAEAYQFWREIYPRDVIPWNNLGDIYLELGQPEQAVELEREAFRLRPDNGIIRAILTQAYQRAGRYDDAKKLYDDTVAQKVDGIHIHFVRYIIAFAENDAAEMQRQRDWARGNQREGEMLDRAGWAAATRGEFRRAHSLFSQAREVAKKSGLQEFAAAVTLDNAQMDADFGFASPAKVAVKQSLQINSKSPIVLAYAAMVLARTGELRQAEELAQRVVKEWPHDTMMIEVMVPAVRGLIDMERKDTASAITEFRRAEPYDLTRMTEFVTTYYRGLAFLADREPDKALQTFQKIIDRRAVAPYSAYVSLANLGLARAHRLAGDTEASRRDYAAFFRAWNNADPDVPVLREARLEYSRLTRAK